MSREDAALRGRGINPAEYEHIAAAERDFWWMRGMNRVMWQFLDALQSEFVGRMACEVGCGTGAVSDGFRQKYPDTPLLSTDLEPEGLCYARERGLDRLALADVRGLPFRNSRFGLLLAMDVITHLELGQELSAFREFGRVLAPGGILLLRTCAFRWLTSRHSTFVCERQRYTLGQIKPLLRDNGFELLRGTYANTLLLPVALAKFRLWEPLMGGEPESGLQSVHPVLNTALEQFLRVEAAWFRAGGSFPVGQSLWIVARKTGGSA